MGSRKAVAFGEQVEASDRVAKLEAQVRELHRRTMALAFAAALLGAGLLCAAGPGVQEVVRCRKLEVVDGNGQVRVAVEGNRNGPTSSLTMNDEAGNACIQMDVHRGLGFLTIDGPGMKGAPQVSIMPPFLTIDDGTKQRVYCPSLIGAGNGELQDSPRRKQ